jgi:arylsulfatase A-like enzyme
MLAEVLTQRGYETAGFVANKFYASRESGLARGFQHYEDFRLSVGAILLGSSLGRYLTGRTPLPRLLGYYEEIGRKPASRVSADALDWLARRGAGDRPFFIFINYYDAHDPYLPPAPFDTLFDRRRIPVNIPIVTDRPVTPRYAIGDVAAYDETLAALDQQLGLLLDELDRRGALMNTLVVIAADHGEEFGEHGLMRHGNSLYAQALHVPLVVAFPGRVPAGRRFGEPVSLRDVAATVLDLTSPVDGGHGSPSVLPGLSLARFWNGDGPPADGVEPLLSEVRYDYGQPRWYPISKGDMASLIDGTRHFIRGGNGAAELYDTEADPGEQRNLAASSRWRDTAQRLAATLRAAVPVSKE